MMKSVTQSELTLLAQSGFISNVAIEPLNSKWILVVRAGATEYSLYTARNQRKEFKKLETVVSFLKNIGLQQAFIKIF